MIEPMVPDHIERVKVCPWCGYDLRGHAADRCPECGGDVRPSTVMKHYASSSHLVAKCRRANLLLPLAYVAIGMGLTGLSRWLAGLDDWVWPIMLGLVLLGGSVVGRHTATGYRRRAQPGDGLRRSRWYTILTSVLTQLVLTVVYSLLCSCLMLPLLAQR